MSPVPMVEVFHEGWVVREGGAVVDASSSVTVVRAGPACIVVDTGSRTDLEAVSEAFASRGVRPEGVTHVVNTHMHTDHCGCNHLFADARFFAHSLEDPPLGTVRVDRDVALVPGVRLVHTPGHTQGSMSVLVESDRRYAICGDAVPTRANYESHAPPAVHVDRALALRSMDALLGWAEVVIPGHDRQFTVVGKR